MIFLTYPLATGKGAKPTLQDLEYVISPTFSALTTIKTNGFSSDFLDHEFPFTPPPLFFFFWPLISQRFEGEKIQRFGILVASPAGVFVGARISSLRTPAVEASILGDILDWLRKLSFPWIYIMQWNLDITNLYITKYSVWWTFFYPKNSKIYGKEPRYKETSLERTYFAIGLSLYQSSSVPWTLLTGKVIDLVAFLFICLSNMLR